MSYTSKAAAFSLQPFRSTPPLYSFRILMMNKRTILQFLILPMTLMSQEVVDKFALPNYLDKVYPRIRYISNGPHIYHLSASHPPWLPNPDGEYGFYFRLIVISSEIWDQLIIEKISMFDEEGIERHVSASEYLNFNAAFPNADFDRQRYIESATWIDSIIVELKINHQLYRIKMDDYFPFTIYEGKIPLKEITIDIIKVIDGTLKNSISIEGQVTDVFGKGMSNIMVSYSARGTTTDESGFFTLADVDPESKIYVIPIAGYKVKHVRISRLISQMNIK